MQGKTQKEVDKVNEVDGLIFQTEKQLKELDEKIGEEDKSKITSKIGELKEALENKDIEKMESLKEEVNQIWQEISTKLYQESADAEPAPDSEDVEYEEVK